MADYVVMFPAGVGDLVATCLAHDLPGSEVLYADDSALGLATRGSGDRETRQIERLPYLNNAFSLLATVPRRPLPAALQDLTDDLSRSQPLDLPRGRTFRILAHLEGALQPLPARERADFERLFQSDHGWRTQPRGGADEELWLWGRRDLDELLLLRRLTQRPRQRARGSLSPELCHLLVRLSRPDDRDVFLDPFAGSGAIAKARADAPAARIICSDLAGEPDSFETPPRARVEWLTDDALTLESLASGSVDAIVTDPPWGEFVPAEADPTTPPTTDEAVAALFAGFVASADRVLHPTRGRLVALVARRLVALMLGRLTGAGFEAEVAAGILVNGHPASVITARRGR